MSRKRAGRYRSQHRPTPGPLTGVQFRLDGVTFTCAGTWSEFAMSDLARRALHADPAAVIAITAESFLLTLGPGEYARFAEHVAAHQTPESVIAAIAEYLREESGWRAALASRTG